MNSSNGVRERHHLHLSICRVDGDLEVTLSSRALAGISDQEGEGVRVVHGGVEGTVVADGHQIDRVA